MVAMEIDVRDLDSVDLDWEMIRSDVYQDRELLDVRRM
jgi:hypothetical protein